VIVREAHEKYKHLDHLLSDRDWIECGNLGDILYDLWQAVKTDSELTTQNEGS